MSLPALEQEYRSLDRTIDRAIDELDDREYGAAVNRLHQVFRAINTTPPTDLQDCAIKLRRLADPVLGMAGGEVEGDGVCLRQVIEFLERRS